ncbi:rhomboid family intramembrane serine protease, partial [bacterium]|nr:rhomboid family intramembrane serine protease [bacterium]
FLVAGAAGNFASALVERYDVAIGASSGIFGLIGAYAVALWRLTGPAYASLRQRLLGTLAVMVLADFAIGAAEPQIDNLAHIGGFVAGLPLGALLAPRRQNLGQPPVPPAIVTGS